MTTDGRLESALARTEADLDTALRRAATLTRELKRARAAAASGQLRELRRGLAAAADAAREVGDAADVAHSGYDADEEQLLTSGAYAKELLAAAAEAGVAMQEEDERLLCYPSVLRVLPSDQAVTIDRKKERRLRPSVLVDILRRAQQAGPRFRPQPFLASLLAGYDLVRARQKKAPGAVVKLLDVYGVLTLLPGQARDYSRQEFARDLYLLDESGVRSVRGRRLRLSASTGTRQAGVLTTVARSGQQQRYWGVAFHDEERNA
ncbi:MAG: hypothetical protein H0W56_11800 [Acidothermales bacterium]|nr:hypothetical protein [Acidothermales bacterium]